MQKKNIYCLTALFALGAALALLAGCATQPTQPAQPQGLSLGDGANGTQVTLKADQALTVRLESNPTTGFSWEIAEVDAAVLKSQGEPQFEEQSNSQQRTGAGGWEVFHFTPAQSGKTNLTLIYHRPWEKNVKPIKTFTVQVMVE